MGKSIFPLNPQQEDFVDPDKRFNSLPYSNEIPEMHIENHKVPPYNIQYIHYKSCREKTSMIAFYSFISGWAIIGNIYASIKYGNAANRWRGLWCNIGGGISGSTLAVLGLFWSDLTCSPLLNGRRRNLFNEEASRHTLNAKYKLYENLDKIMMSKERITKQEFYEAFQRASVNPDNIIGIN